MLDCDENMALCYVILKKLERQAQPVTSSGRLINIMNINGLASGVIR